MRADQISRLQALSEKVADVALFDIDPENWVGQGVAAKDLTKDERGDAYWCRKVAISSLAVLTRISNLTTVINAPGKPAGEDEGDSSLQQEIAQAESEAKTLLDAVARQAKKTDFHRKIHGKA